MPTFVTEFLLTKRSFQFSSKERRTNVSSDKSISGQRFSLCLSLNSFKPWTVAPSGDSTYHDYLCVSLAYHLGRWDKDQRLGNALNARGFVGVT